MTAILYLQFDCFKTGFSKKKKTTHKAISLLKMVVCLPCDKFVVISLFILQWCQSFYILPDFSSFLKGICLSFSSEGKKQWAKLYIQKLSWLLRHKQAASPTYIGMTLPSASSHFYTLIRYLYIFGLITSL